VDANPPYTITTVAGANSELDGPYGIALDQNSGDLYIADTLSNTIRFVDATSHNISTLAGDGNEGYADGAPASAEFNLPRGVALAGGNLYITDFENSVVRRLGPAPPGKPKNVAATAGNSSAHVSWDAPDFDGGSPITGYTVTGDPGGTTVTVGGDATSADVNGLTNGTSYTFTVTAANAIGTGPSSDPSNAITAGNNTVSRLAGDDRIGTAIAVSKTAFSAPGSADAVVLATAYDYPDALAGTPLAAAKHAPLLLTGADQLDQQTKVEIQRVLTAGKTVYLLGGPVALNGAVEDQVRSMGYATTRYAGGNRYQTAVAIADQGLANPSTLLLATGTNFADALSGSAAAAVAKAAILLTDGSTMAPDTASYLGQHAGAKTYALGGPAAAADPSATPIVGADRYDTSAHVASQFFDAPKVVGVATGINYPDALSGGAQMGMQAGPMLLTLPDSLPKPVSSYCAAKKDSIDGAFIYGGTLAVHDSVSADVGVAIT
jgi:putative cell wall-binding protein